MALAELTPDYEEQVQPHKRERITVEHWRAPDRAHIISEQRERLPEVVSLSVLRHDGPAVSQLVNERDRRLKTGSRILRRGILLLMAALAVGVALLAFTGPVGSALGFALLYSGVLAMLVAQYAFGLQVGQYLIGPRYSVLGIIGFLGLILTALAAALERAISG